MKLTWRRSVRLFVVTMMITSVLLALSSVAVATNGFRMAQGPCSNCCVSGGWCGYNGCGYCGIIPKTRFVQQGSYRICYNSRRIQTSFDYRCDQVCQLVVGGSSGCP